MDRDRGRNRLCKVRQMVLEEFSIQPDEKLPDVCSNPYNPSDENVVSESSIVELFNLSSDCNFEVKPMETELTFNGETLSFALVPDDEPRHKRKSDNWSKYNKAQVHEHELFDELLYQLASTVEEPEYHTGRPPVPMKDQIFCAVKKVYGQMSSRRSQWFFRDAETQSIIASAPHFNVVSKFLNREHTDKLLHDLLIYSALPLTGVENNFAVDSSGFRTTSFNYYCRERHHTDRKNIWLKAHILVGVRTNIIANAALTTKTTGDITMFEPLLEGIRENFNIDEVYADKAYSSKRAHEYVESLGGRAYIPFKKNVIGRARGSSTWKKAYHYFQINREEFDERYHLRSNVESVFSAIKNKLGETLKSRNRRAQMNELYCKMIAYNLTVLVHEMFDLGIVPKF